MNKNAPSPFPCHSTHGQAFEEKDEVREKIDRWIQKQSVQELLMRIGSKLYSLNHIGLHWCKST
jgi:hypothetical protein